MDHTDTPQKRILLRSWRCSDSEHQALVMHLDNLNVSKHLRDTVPHPYTMDDATAWTTYCLNQYPSTEHSTTTHETQVTEFAITLAEQPDMPIGGIGLRLGSGVYRHQAELGYWLAEPYWGRGIMTAAAMFIVHTYAFTTLNLDRIASGCYSDNAASRHLLETKLHMTLEGCRRKACCKNGEFKDELQFGVLKDEFWVVGNNTNTSKGWVVNVDVFVATPP